MGGTFQGVKIIRRNLKKSSCVFVHDIKNFILKVNKDVKLHENLATLLSTLKFQILQGQKKILVKLENTTLSLELWNFDNLVHLEFKVQCYKSSHICCIGLMPLSTLEFQTFEGVQGSVISLVEWVLHFCAFWHFKTKLNGNIRTWVEELNNICCMHNVQKLFPLEHFLFHVSFGKIESWWLKTTVGWEHVNFISILCYLWEPIVPFKNTFDITILNYSYHSLWKVFGQVSDKNLIVNFIQNLALSCWKIFRSAGESGEVIVESIAEVLRRADRDGGQADGRRVVGGHGGGGRRLRPGREGAVDDVGSATKATTDNGELGTGLLRLLMCVYITLLYGWKETLQKNERALS